MTNYPPATKTPCNACPWKRDSAPGWLGPYDAQTWLNIAHGEGAIACHITITDDDDWDAPGMKQCAGAAIFRANVHKMPHNPTIARAEERDTETVFAWNDEFIDHHTKQRAKRV